MNTTIIFIVVGIVVAAIVLGVVVGFINAILDAYRSVSTVWQYQVGLHFHGGRMVEVLAPGKHSFWGKGHTVLNFDTRSQELVVQGQELITADKATLKVTAVLVYRITDAEKMHGAAVDPAAAIYTAVQLGLREIVGSQEIDRFIEKKATYGTALTETVKATAETLGLTVDRIEIRDVIVGGDLKSVYTGVLRARMEALAELEKARGEAAALRTMANASRVFENNPALLQMRYLQTLEQFAGGSHGNTIVVGKPEDFAIRVTNA